jgi:hypothetical protein
MYASPSVGLLCSRQIDGPTWQRPLLADSVEKAGGGQITDFCADFAWRAGWLVDLRVVYMIIII